MASSSAAAATQFQNPFLRYKTPFSDNKLSPNGYRISFCNFKPRSSNNGKKPQFYRSLSVVNEKVLGIDLGTTNSAVAAMEGGKPTIVTNAEGQRTTPSVVAYTKNGDRLVGQIAKKQAMVNFENKFFSVKRFFGRKMSEVNEERKQVAYKAVRDENNN
ncbi:stromal 70 kDa heat shock-related protein, chloroplastic-like [Coffea eugenioides]|uniref:stromal 70 kDa heat shock-related protein, chloroplastic-like n=1 Tax=Coffea eugenioides TaxID=49369 RepID=UPI000F60F4C1|nr:stromal 70 kDa heat shock-related protein, chloroplastic-like [Coffea eugenioides]